MSTRDGCTPRPWDCPSCPTCSTSSPPWFSSRGGKSKWSAPVGQQPFVVEGVGAYLALGAVVDDDDLFNGFEGSASTCWMTGQQGTIDDEEAVRRVIDDVRELIVEQTDVEGVQHAAFASAPRSTARGGDGGSSSNVAYPLTGPQAEGAPQRARQTVHALGEVTVGVAVARSELRPWTISRSGNKRVPRSNIVPQRERETFIVPEHDRERLPHLVMPSRRPWPAERLELLKRHPRRQCSDRGRHR